MDNPPLPAVSLVRGRRYSRGSSQMLDASLSPDKEPLPDYRTSDPKLLGAKCRILQSLPTRTPVDYRDRAPKAHTRFHPTSPIRTPIDYMRRPSVQHTPGGVKWRIGSGDKVRILEDAWIPDSTNLFVISRHPGLVDQKVNGLMKTGLKEWDFEVIRDMFVA
ncbi:hypothetical protein AgCh_037747 [Apium graveolens]